MLNISMFFYALVMDDPIQYIYMTLKWIITTIQLDKWSAWKHVSLTNIQESQLQKKKSVHLIFANVFIMYKINRAVLLTLFLLLEMPPDSSSYYVTSSTGKGLYYPTKKTHNTT